MIPKISVIICAYNAANCLGASIESILDQSFKDLELIIIDDSSTDDTPDLIKRCAAKDERIIYINNEKNLGPSKSRNKGLKIAKGDYIAIQDADDISLSTRLEMQYDFLQNHPDIFLVGGGTSNITHSGKKTTTFIPETNEVNSNKALLKKCTIVNSTIMFRNGQNIFYRDKFRYAMDYDLFLILLSKEKRMTNLPEILIKRRLLPGSISFGKRVHQELFAEKAREFYEQRSLEGKDGYDKFDPDEILEVNIENLSGCKLIGYEIEARFKVSEFKEVKKLYGRYLKYRKLPNKYLLYFVASFFPRSFVDFLRRIMWG